MKKNIFLLLGLTVALRVHATLYSYDYNGVNAVIPDANPVGITSGQGVNLGVLPLDGTTAEIVNVNVRLTVTGGYNGDLYGYLVLQSADSSTTTAILLNRVGRVAAADFGYATAGFNVTLSGETGVDIHGVGNPGAGPYLADGRAVDPLGDFTGAARTAGLEVLNGKNANGTWTLFLADLSGGDTATLVSWGLDISVVPEPITCALMILGAAGLAAALRRRLAAG